MRNLSNQKSELVIKILSGREPIQYDASFSRAQKGKRERMH